MAIRRISLEWAEVRRWLAEGVGEPPPSGGGSRGIGGLGRLLRRKAAVGEAIDRGRATRRFEPSGGPSDPAPAGADEYVSEIPAGPATPTAPQGDRTVSNREGKRTGGVSRLQKAKLRAKHQRREARRGHPVSRGRAQPSAVERAGNRTHLTITSDPVGVSRISRG